MVRALARRTPLGFLSSGLRSPAHRQELPPPLGQLPPPGPQARPHHRRRGAPHPQPPRRVGLPLVQDRQEAPRPHRQRDQELLEDAHEEEGPGGEDARQEQGLLLAVLLLRRLHVAYDDDLLGLPNGHVLLGGDHRGGAAGKYYQHGRRGRGGGRHVGERGEEGGGGAVLLPRGHGPALERHRRVGEVPGDDDELGRSRPRGHARPRRGAFVAGMGVLRGLLPVEDRRPRVLQQDRSTRSELRGFHYVSLVVLVLPS
ncbi:hypothetical protein VPH35_006253 [Triticum aestivum]